MISISSEPALLRWLRNFQVGFTPPFALGVGLPFSKLDFEEGYREFRDSQIDMVGFALLGLFCWIIITVYLGRITTARFRQVCGRLPHRQPEWGGVYRQPETSTPAGLSDR